MRNDMLYLRSYFDMLTFPLKPVHRTITNRGTILVYFDGMFVFGSIPIDLKNYVTDSRYFEAKENWFDLGRRCHCS
jgi:hypothetical protein